MSWDLTTARFFFLLSVPLKKKALLTYNSQIIQLTRLKCTSQ